MKITRGGQLKVVRRISRLFVTLLFLLLPVTSLYGPNCSPWPIPDLYRWKPARFFFRSAYFLAIAERIGRTGQVRM